MARDPKQPRIGAAQCRPIGASLRKGQLERSLHDVLRGRWIERHRHRMRIQRLAGATEEFGKRLRVEFLSHEQRHVIRLLLLIRPPEPKRHRECSRDKMSGMETTCCVRGHEAYFPPPGA